MSKKNYFFFTKACGQPLRHRPAWRWSREVQKLKKLTQKLITKKQVVKLLETGLLGGGAGKYMDYDV